MNKPQVRIKITPSYLWEQGYKYKSAGIQGADMWQGMGYWIHDKTGFTLRGNKGVSYPLKLSGYFNSHIEYIDELENIFEILNAY